MKNLALAEDVLATIEHQPNQFNMSVWADLDNPDKIDDFSCGTTACLAGWTLIKAGGKVVAGDSIEMPDHDIVRGMTIGDRARELLGLTEGELYDFSHGGQRLWSLADDYLAILRFRQLVEAERARRNQVAADAIGPVT